jgi:hypothetical protein
MQKLGNKVSRVLEAKDKSFNSVVFQPLRPPLDSEFNLLQNIQNNIISDILRSFHKSGFITRGEITTRPENGSGFWKNAIKIKNPSVLINGKILFLGAGTNQFQVGASDNIWKILSNQEDELVFLVGDGPDSGSRDDVVFLEVWDELVNPSSAINKFGNAQTALSPFTNDLIDPSINRETSIRVQTKYRIRVAEGVDLVSYREGLGHPSIFGQGAKSLPVSNSNYVFQKTEMGHYVAGNGTDQSANDLGTVDGYVYALPLCSLHRKNKTIYSNSNPNGASKLLSEGNSDRPDGIFGDEIYRFDIEDLRHTVAIEEDLKAICDESLDNIIRGVPDRLVLGDRPDIFSSVNIQIDGISATDRPNINESFLRRPNNVKRNFTDSEKTQRTVIYLAAATLNSLSQLEIFPPQFYTVADSEQYRSYNPFIGAENIPKIYNAQTGAEIIPSNVGINGWSNLGDRVNKDKVTFRPSAAGDLAGKPIIVEYDLVIPSGSGLFKIPRTVYNVRDDMKATDVVFTEDEKVISQELNRVVQGTWRDSQTIFPVSRFINPTAQQENFRGGVIERVYHITGNGSGKVTIPSTIDGRSVLTIGRVQFSGGQDIPLGFSSNPKVLRRADGAFEINFQSYFPTLNDIIKVTVLMSGYACEINRKNKGLENFSQTLMYQLTSTGANQYNISPVTQVLNKMEFVYGVAGLYDGSSYKAHAYVADTQTSDGKWAEISSVTGLNSSRITINFPLAPEAGKIIYIPMIGSFAPLTTDQYTVTYDYVPYQGLSSLLSTNESLEAEVVYVCDNAKVTTNGTGSSNPKNYEGAPQIPSQISEGVYGISTRLPLNSTDYDYQLDNSNILVPNSKAIGSTKDLPYRYDSYPETKSLKMGDILVIKKESDASPYAVQRGCSLESPKISYRVDDLIERLEENVTLQVNGGNRIFKVSRKIMAIHNTVCLSRTWKMVGLAVFNNSSTTVSGLNAFFTRSIRPGYLIRPLGSTTWYEVSKITDDATLTIKIPFSEPSTTSDWEIYAPDLIVLKNGVELEPEDILEVFGNEGMVVLREAPDLTDKVVIKYRTGSNTLNIIHGLAIGKGVLEGELLSFVITTTSNIESVNRPEFNLLKVGSANHLIFNNNLEVTSLEGTLNEANRVVIAADFFYTKNRRLSINQKV